MSDTKTPSDKTLHVSPKTLSLKRPAEQNTVRQSFSHGRSKSVVVETVKRRAPGAPPAPTREGAAAPVSLARPAPSAGAAARAPAPTLPAGRPQQITLPSRPAPEPTPAPVAAAEPRPAPAPRAAAPAPRPAPVAARRAEPAPTPPAAPPRPAPTARPTGVVLRTLTEQERDARLSALTDAKRDEDESRRQAESAQRQREERDARDVREREAAEARKRDEDERRRSEDERKRRAEEEARRRLGEEAGVSQMSRASALDAHRRPMNLDALGRRPAPAAGATARPGAAGAAARPGAAPGARPPAGASARPLGRPAAAADEEGNEKRVIRRPGMPLKIVVPPKTPKAGPGGRDRRGRLTISTATSGEDERTRSIASMRRRQQRLTGHRHQEEKEKLVREVTVPESITIQDLANRMSERGVDVIKFLMRQGQIHKITDTIDADTAQLVAEEFGHTVKRVAESDVEEGLFDQPDDHPNDLEPRPPVVTIMGHVDHGKTSLLDAIREANVVSGEAGGITQHIGAYQVKAPSGGYITFIDTPGHAAFTAMRARGAKITDIVVLVVAADDGVMPQTVEAISHAKAAGVPIVIAINKMDKPGAKPDRVRQELLQHDIQVESMGGETLEFEVSALKKTGLDTLLDGLLLQAEVLDLKANPVRDAEGTVIEAKLDRGRGPVATVLVQRGTLYAGDIVVAGAEWGRVRAILDDQGETIREAGPSFPAEVLGFNGTPDAGDRMAVVETEGRAREITEYRARQKRERAAARVQGARSSLADMMRDLKEGSGRKEFPLVVKGDVGGSVEAIVTALEKVGNDEVQARILHAGVGGITESDITLATASGATVIGFNVRAHKEAREAAERAGVEIRYYNIIYNLVDDVKDAMSGLLAPHLREERLGEARILEVFDVSKVGKVAGCRVEDGRVERGANVRLIRDNVVIHEGKLSTLKRFKDDAKEVVAGQECGMSFEGYDKIRAGDFIECYLVHEEKRSL